jgi:hypothetical protein
LKELGTHGASGASLARKEARVPISKDNDPPSALTAEERLGRFLDACREVQHQAAALSADVDLRPRVRDVIRDLRLMLLSTRKALLEPRGESTSIGATAAQDSSPSSVEKVRLTSRSKGRHR